jgi:hypothetical protein
MSDKISSDKKFMWGQPPSAVRPGVARRCTIILFLVGVMSLPFAAKAQKNSAARPTEDLPAGSMQAKATTACTECHEARIILQQRLSKGAWAKEVDKMIKWGAVVDASDHDALIDYLSANFNPDQPPYEPSRSSTKKTSNSKTSN